MTLTVYLRTYRDRMPDEKFVVRSIETGADEVSAQLSDHGFSEVCSTPLHEVTEEDLPTWVHRSFSQVIGLRPKKKP